jgi:hypothetical protein
MLRDNVVKVFLYMLILLVCSLDIVYVGYWWYNGEIKRSLGV